MHRHPELSNHEFRTTDLLASELADAGLPRPERLEHTGLVIDIPGAVPGPLVAVRGDLDALPITERSAYEHASTVAGVMHACGHDVHTAVAFGVALASHQIAAHLQGTLRVIFQPAEEAEPLGARAVINAGFLDDVDAIIALHVSPDLQVGDIGVRPGAAMASSDEFTIQLRGRSSHAGWPHRGRDAIAAAGSIIQESQKIVSRRTDSREPLVVNFGKITSGGSGNIVADDVRLEGTIRSLSPEARSTAKAVLSQIVDGVSIASDVAASLDLVSGEPVLHNDPRLIETFRATGRDLSDCHSVHELGEATMNSEDFAFYSERVPAAMVWLGGTEPDQAEIYPLHHPSLTVSERALDLGVRLLLDTAIRLLGQTTR